MSLIPDNTKVPQPNEVNSPVRYIEGVRSLSPLEWRELDESPTKINPWFSLFLPLCCKVGKFFLDQGEDTTRRVYYASCSLTYLLAMVASNMALQWINYPTQVSFFFLSFLCAIRYELIIRWEVYKSGYKSTYYFSLLVSYYSLFILFFVSHALASMLMVQAFLMFITEITLPQQTLFISVNTSVFMFLLLTFMLFSYLFLATVDVHSITHDIWFHQIDVKTYCLQSTVTFLGCPL